MLNTLLATLILLIGAQAPDTLKPEDFGAKGDGVSDDGLAFTKLVDQINSKGGNVVVVGNPSATYKVGRDLTISASNVTFDWKNARIVGNTRFEFEGKPGSLLSNVWFSNVRLGDGTMNPCPRGPKFAFCQNSGAENIVKDGFTGTAFNGQFSKNLLFRNIQNKRSRSNGEAIGFLLWFCDNSVIDNTTVEEGQFLYGWQVKGGKDNVVKNSHSRNVTPGGRLTLKSASGDFTVGDMVSGSSSRAQARVVAIDKASNEIQVDLQEREFRSGESISSSRGGRAELTGEPEYRRPRAAFFDRGDAPYKSSNSKNTGQPYPFSEGAFDKPDPRRVTTNSRYENCSTSSSDRWQVSFLSQESVGTQWVACKAGSRGKDFVRAKVQGDPGRDDGDGG